MSRTQNFVTLVCQAGLLLAVALYSSGPAAAALVAYDTFNSYDAGEITGLNGGTGWAGGWLVFDEDREDVIDTTAITPPAPSMPYADPFPKRAVRAFGNGGPSPNNANGNPIQRELASPFTGNDLYVSFLWRSEQPFGTSEFFVFWADDEAAANMEDRHDDDDVAFLGALGDHEFFARLVNGSGTNSQGLTSTGSFAANEDHFILGRLTKNGGPDFDQLSLWVDPASSSPGSPDVSVSRSTGMTQITHVGLRTGQYTDPGDAFLFDQLSLGTTIADVVPPEIAADDFDLPAGELNGRNGGWGFGADAAHEWKADTDRTEVVNPTSPLEFGPLDGGNRAVEIDGGGGAGPKNHLSRQLAGDLPDEFYFSFLGRYDGLDDNDFFAFWLDGNGNTSDAHNDVPNIGVRQGEFFLRLNINEEESLGAAGDGETFFLVGHILKSGDDYTFDAWLNPAAPNLPPDETVLKTDSGMADFGFLGVRMGSNSDEGDKLFLDRIRFGSSYLDVAFEPAAVIPEPSTCVVWGLLVVLGLGLYRRRSQE